MKTKRDRINRIVKIAIFASLYIVLTYLTYPVSYGDLGIELRISEVLVLLCFFNKEYILAMTAGCFLANIFGTMGIVDAIFGTFATFISCVCVNKSKNLFIASLFPVIFNGIIIGLELYFIYDMPYHLAFLGVAVGEFIAVSIAGCLLFKLLMKNQTFMDFISLDEKYDL